MDTHHIVCDLCAKSAPKEFALANGFTCLNLQGEGPSKFRQLLGPNCPSHTDFCPECFAGFLGWAEDRKRSFQPKPAPVHAEPVHAEPVHAESEHVHAEPSPETFHEDSPPDAPTPSPEAAQEETPA